MVPFSEIFVVTVKTPKKVAKNFIDLIKKPDF